MYRQNPRYIQSDIADAQNADILGMWLNIPVARDIGMSVVPGDEFGRAIRPVQIDAGNVQVAVASRPCGENHGIVKLLKVFEFKVVAIFDIAEKSNRRICHDAFERLDRKSG